LHVKTLILSAIFTLSATIPGFTLDIYLNRQPVRSWSRDSLETLSYTIPATNGFSSGLSLDEVLPLCVSAYRMRAVGKNESRTVERTFEDEQMAEKFHTWYLTASPSGQWDLFVAGSRVPAVHTIELYGEPLSEKQLEIWVSWEGVPLLKEEIRRFSDLHDLQIKVTEVPRIETKMISVLRAGGRPADVVMVQSDYLPALVRSRAIQRLDYLSFDSLIAKARRSFTLDGGSWAVPFYFDSQLLFYNPRLLAEEPALDWTLADLERLAEGVRTRFPKTSPMTWNAYSAYWLAAFQIGFGKEELVQADGSIRIDEPATHRALTYLLDLQRRGLLDVGEREAMISLFTSERVAMILTGSYSIPLLERLNVEFGVIPYPAVKRGGRSLAPFLDFKGWAVSRTTYSPVLARRLIRYLSGIGVQQRFPAELSKLPVNRECWQIMSRTNRYYPVLARSTEIGVPVPTEEAYGVYKNTMWKLLRFLFSGQMGVEELLKQGQQIIDAQMSHNAR